MLKGKGNFIKHMGRLIIDFSKRPVFRVVIMIVIAAAVTVIGLTSSVSDKAENERDLLQKFNISENKSIFNALESKSAITRYKPFISEEAIKLNSLEKPLWVRIFIGRNE